MGPNPPLPSPRRRRKAFTLKKKFFHPRSPGGVPKDGHGDHSNGALGRDRVHQEGRRTQTGEDQAPTASVTVSSATAKGLPCSAGGTLDGHQAAGARRGRDNGDNERGQRGPEPVRRELTDGAGGVPVAVDDDGRRAAGVGQDAQPQQGGQRRDYRRRRQPCRRQTCRHRACRSQHAGRSRRTTGRRRDSADVASCNRCSYCPSSDRCS